MENTEYYAVVGQCEGWYESEKILGKSYFGWNHIFEPIHYTVSTKEADIDTLQKIQSWAKAELQASVICEIRDELEILCNSPQEQIKKLERIVKNSDAPRMDFSDPNECNDVLYTLKIYEKGNFKNKITEVHTWESSVAQHLLDEIHAEVRV